MTDQPTPRAPEPDIAGARPGEDWTTLTEAPCEAAIAHQRHVWRGLFPDPRFCPGVPSDFEIAVTARGVQTCEHLVAGDRCVRCGKPVVCATAAPTPAPEPSAPDDLQEPLADLLIEHLFREPNAADDVIRCVCGQEFPPLDGLQDWSAFTDHQAAAVMDVLRREGLVKG